MALDIQGGALWHTDCGGACSPCTEPRAHVVNRVPNQLLRGQLPSPITGRSPRIRDAVTENQTAGRWVWMLTCAAARTESNRPSLNGRNDRKIERRLHFSQSVLSSDVFIVLRRRPEVPEATRAKRDPMCFVKTT